MSTAFQLSKSLARNAPREFWFLPSLFSPGIRLQAHGRKMKGSACILRTCPGIITLTWSYHRLSSVVVGSSCLFRAVYHCIAAIRDKWLFQIVFSVRPDNDESWMAVAMV